MKRDPAAPEVEAEEQESLSLGWVLTIFFQLLSHKMIVEMLAVGEGKATARLKSTPFRHR
jgi:hypothetical protein